MLEWHLSSKLNSIQMNNFKMSGVVKVVGDSKQVTDKFTKRDLVLTVTDGKYDQHVSFTFVNENANKLDSIAEGQEVEVSFNINGREWQDKSGEIKYFNTLQGWRVDEVDVAQMPEPQKEEESDLPF